MLRSRIIPCLLVRDGGLVKTVKFDAPKYVGDPLNAVRIFNEKGVDELAVLDISATPKGREPDYELIAHLAAECRMPLCYGGGVTSVEQVDRIVGLGVEKVALGTAAVESPSIIEDASRRVGSQSVSVVLDVKKAGWLGEYKVFTRGGRRNSNWGPAEFSRKAQDLGAGEIILNSIDSDGTMEGYDLNLVRKTRAAHDLPMTVFGGAGSKDDIIGLIKEFGIIGAGAGSLFVFKGKYRAVLINYPNPTEMAAIFEAAGIQAA